MRYMGRIAIVVVTMNTPTKFYLGVSASEVVDVEARLGQGLGGAAFGIRGHVSEDLGRDDGVTSHEVGVGHLVRQTQHANTNT